MILATSCMRALPLTKIDAHCLHVSGVTALQGVQSAVVVVCFISQKYQASRNCALEVRISLAYVYAVPRNPTDRCNSVRCA
eukprot:COSAG01_NODE_909_length_12785_cov_4.201876_4_plen_81_part_00